jgi:hypothetical protein
MILQETPIDLFIAGPEYFPTQGIPERFRTITPATDQFSGGNWTVLPPSV